MLKHSHPTIPLPCWLKVWLGPLKLPINPLVALQSSHLKLHQLLQQSDMTIYIIHTVHINQKCSLPCNQCGHASCEPTKFTANQCTLLICKSLCCNCGFLHVPFNSAASGKLGQLGHHGQKLQDLLTCPPFHSWLATHCHGIWIEGLRRSCEVSTGPPAVIPHISQLPAPMATAPDTAAPKASKTWETQLEIACFEHGLNVRPKQVEPIVVDWNNKRGIARWAPQPGKCTQLHHSHHFARAWIVTECLWSKTFNSQL